MKNKDTNRMIINYVYVVSVLLVSFLIAKILIPYNAIIQRQCFLLLSIISYISYIILFDYEEK